MWLVGELEDEEVLWDQFTVSALPELWFVIKNMRLYCYFPKIEPGKKIRSAEQPVANDENWKLYKCRVLMNGGEILLLFVRKHK